ncbi:MAG: adenylate kinase [Chloroflexota bacterium]|nr:adenylate kinase [Chloroflexota bacterium]
MGAGLAGLLAIPHIELDSLFWCPNWTECPTEVFRDRVTEATSGDTWVVDGNYGKARDILWSRADTVIWLDYTLPVILYRLTRRNAYRIGRGVELWNGNRETLRATLGRDSLYVWALRTYRRRRLEYVEHFRRPEYTHLRVLHFRSPRQARCWLAELTTELRSRDVSARS